MFCVKALRADILLKDRKGCIETAKPRVIQPFVCFILACTLRLIWRRHDDNRPLCSNCRG